MATITVRNLDVEVQRRLKRRAARNERSMEAEARAILTAAVEEEGFVDAWLEAIRDLKGDQLSLPRRSLPRPTDVG